MKKSLVVLIGVLLSAFSFSAGLENIPKDVFIKAGVSEANIEKALDLSKLAKIEIEKNQIEAKKVDLDIKYLLLDETKDWVKIENLMKKSSGYRIKAKIKILKVKEELKKYITEAQFKMIFREMRQRNDKRMKFQKKRKGNRPKRGNEPKRVKRAY
ncbi:hypothetical protein [Haliovirga abyssi]|uniref:DUF4168 domain-containing protein n=1 Tax=Haliovirga abyssi TaxID=2996794 RepID=A0AAU9DCC0_9FUSO|nr:hypothetical protein [Haliovirga abyssi]BDU50950.1 hypothetical protein HLVA_15190 [Haliovirga abyssi]